MKIQPGYRVGKLTVSHDAEERKNGYVVWWCDCDCGGRIKLDTRSLQRGMVEDCGCVTKVSPRQKDITGQRFGKLTVLVPTEERDRNGATCWKCRCDCGTEVTVSAPMLKNGYKKSCGCMRRSVIEDLTGKTFGNLTVIGEAPRNAGMRYWNCSCKCGQETVVRQTNLLEGRTRSCGCLQAEQIRESMKFVEGTSVRMLENIQNRLNTSNSSGHNGIYFNRKNQKWIAQITFKKKTYYLGSFADISEAVTARKAAEDRIYGEFLDWYYEQKK